MEVNRLDVFLIALDPTLGHEIKKTRPGLIISPDELNHNAGTVIIAPMTTKARRYPTRVDCSFQDRDGQIVLDQIRTVDKKRLVRKLGQVSPATGDRALEVLAEMFQK